MKPTLEQQAIIHAAEAGESLSVIARAGCGKTASLRMVADAIPTRSALLLTFNRSAADDARLRLRGRMWVDVRTAHSLAWGALGSQYGDRVTTNPWAVRAWILETFGRELASFERQDGDRERAASVVLDGLGHFCHSADDVPVQSHLPKDFLRTMGREAGATAAMVDLVRRAWIRIADLQSSAPVTHDVYLKQFSLCCPRLGFESIWMDESQDADPAMLRIVLEQDHAQRILVGDPSQSIYGFRDAVDAMDVAPFRRVPLTMCWRFGEEIAKAANFVLAAMGQEHLIQGRGPVGDVVPYSDDVPTMVLARSNAGVVEEALDLLDRDAKMAILGGAEAVVQAVRAAFDLYCGERTTHPIFRFFKTFEELEEAAESDQGGILKTYVRLVLKYRTGIPLVCDRLLRESVIEKRADVVVGTVHSAKGRESDHVRLAADFPAFCAPKGERGELQLDMEEARVAYVALTRAIRLLEIGAYAQALQSSLRCARLLAQGIRFDQEFPVAS